MFILLITPLIFLGTTMGGCYLFKKRQQRKRNTLINQQFLPEPPNSNVPTSSSHLILEEAVEKHKSEVTTKKSKERINEEIDFFANIFIIFIIYYRSEFKYVPHISKYIEKIAYRLSPRDFECFIEDFTTLKKEDRFASISFKTKYSEQKGLRIKFKVGEDYKDKMHIKREIYDVLADYKEDIMKLLDLYKITLNTLYFDETFENEKTQAAFCHFLEKMSHTLDDYYEKSHEKNQDILLHFFDTYKPRTTSPYDELELEELFEHVCLSDDNVGEISKIPPLTERLAYLKKQEKTVGLYDDTDSIE